MALQEIALKLCYNQKQPRRVLSFTPVDLRCTYQPIQKQIPASKYQPSDSLRHLPHRVISLAVCSSPWMSVMELSPLLSVSTPISSLPLSLASLFLLRWARDVTTFASVPRSPWDGSSCWTDNSRYQTCLIQLEFASTALSLYSTEQLRQYRSKSHRCLDSSAFCIKQIPLVINVKYLFKPKFPRGSLYKISLAE